MSPARIRLLVWKEFKQLRRDPLLLRIIFAMPVVQLIMFGYVVAADVNHLPTAVVDLDHSAVSRQVEDAFTASGYFTIDAHPMTESGVRPLMDSATIAVAVVVPEGTQAALDRGETAPIGVIVDGADGQTSGVALSYATQIVQQVNARRLAGTGVDTTTASGLDARIRVEYNPSIRALNSMLPGLIGIICMISITVVMSQAVVKERESGTLEQMFVTPITHTEYLVGKVIPYTLVALAQASLVAVVGVTWFRVPFNGDVVAVLAVVVGLLLFMLTALGLGLLISVVSRTRHQAQQTVMFLLLPAMLLSGYIFPLESMPKVLLPVAYAIPLTHVLAVMRGAFVHGAGFSALAVPLLALAGFAVLIFGAALVTVRRRLRGPDVPVPPQPASSARRGSRRRRTGRRPAPRLRVVHRGRRNQLRGPPRRGLRVPRPQRLGQDHDDQDPHRFLGTQRRAGPGARHRRRA
ncbi:ABC transporter permease [Raineyella fluvialis]|uniref:ABC transporter permease n=1 Tax=Raineyella fluvialis TaxID=2662261 RepID=UPI001EEFB008